MHQTVPAPSHRYRSKHTHHEAAHPLSPHSPAALQPALHAPNSPPDLPKYPVHLLHSRSHKAAPTHAACNKQNPKSHPSAAATPPCPPPPAQCHARAEDSQTPAPQNSHAESQHNAATAHHASPQSHPRHQPDSHTFAKAAPQPWSIVAAAERMIQTALAQIASAVETARAAGPASLPNSASHSQRNSPAAPSPHATSAYA